MLHDAMLPIRAIADSIAARGIHHVTGRVAAAGDHFPGSELGFGWSYDDFEDSYSAPVDELLFNEGFSELHVKAGERAGDPVTVVVRPARSMPRVRVNASTVAAAPGDSARRRANTLVARKDSTSWDVILTGTLAARDTAVIEVTHHNATDAYLAAVREALADRGVSFDDQPTDTLARVDTIATLTSPPLSEILKALMKPSQNQIAEMLFRTTALEKSGAGRPDSARAIVERQIASWGAAVPQEAVVRDGSGLSRYDYISPQTVVRILDAMKKAPTFGVFYDALPIAGVDGTIRNRMKGTPAENNVHAKTGSVAQSRSLSGYVTTADRHMLIFSFLSNNWTVPIRSVERVQDAIASRRCGFAEWPLASARRASVFSPPSLPFRRSPCRCATRSGSCSPKTSSRRSNTRRGTTRPWTAMRFARPTSLAPPRMRRSSSRCWRLFERDSGRRARSRTERRFAS
jgi:D-alanyl-D-alanine carboxypeptidase/D-alanyl-D-alanine-endopeptidase (penicillin-binding protein 4)